MNASYRATLFRSVLLLLLGLYLLGRFADGTLDFYINERFAWLTFLAGLACLVLAYAEAQPLFERRRHQESGQPSPLNLLPPRHIGMAWVMLIPLLLGTMLPPRPLSASAIAQRGLSSVDAPTISRVQSGQEERAPEERDILDWLYLLSQNPDPSQFVGQPADVMGFVYHDPRWERSEGFMLARFVVSCCVADATAIGLPVLWDQGDAPLAEDTWVRVQGQIGIDTVNGEPLPVLIAEDVTFIPEPDQPYLFPS